MEYYCEFDIVKKLRFLSKKYSNERLILKRECSICDLSLSKIYQFENIHISNINLLINEQKNTIGYFISNLKKLSIDCDLFSFDETKRLADFKSKTNFILLNRLNGLKESNIRCSYDENENFRDKFKEHYTYVRDFDKLMDNIFNNLTSESQLKKLKIVCIDLTYSPKNIFDKLSNLEILVIELENGAQIGDIFSKLNNLKVLKITCSNFIDKLSNILNLPNLKILKINCSDFDGELKYSFDKLVNLETLSLQFIDFLHNFDNVFDKLTNLKNLSISSFTVDLESDHEKNEYIFDKLVKLERLSISSVYLINLENSLDKLINLKILKISCDEFDHPLNEIFNKLIAQNKLRMVKISCANKIFIKEELKYGNLLNLEKLSINSQKINKTAKGSEEIKTVLDEIKFLN